jgi:ECF transporter S component (folate family)
MGVLILSGCGMLLALKVVLGMFTLNVSPVLKIGFSFLPVAAAGMLFGPLAGGMVGALGDIVSYFISPTGPYFPGFTLNAFLAGFLYGLFLYKKNVTFVRTFCAKASVTVCVSFLLNPLWLSVLYSKAFFVILSARIVTNLILLPIDVLLLFGLLKTMKREPLFHIRKP